MDVDVDGGRAGARSPSMLQTRFYLPTPTPHNLQEIWLCRQENTLRTMKSVVQQRPETSQTSTWEKERKGTRASPAVQRTRL